MKDWYFFVREASAGNRRAARSVATRLGSRGVGSKLCRHELLLDTSSTQVNNVLELSGKHSKLWQIYTLISPLYSLFSHQHYFLILSRF